MIEKFRTLGIYSCIPKWQLSVQIGSKKFSFEFSEANKVFKSIFADKNLPVDYDKHMLLLFSPPHPLVRYFYMIARSEPLNQGFIRHRPFIEI